MAKQTKKVVKYRKPLNLNLGIIIFTMMFIYIIVCIFSYFTKSHITAYEVRIGSLARNNIYEGIIIRKEEVVQSTNAGYINYYARESERVSTGSMVYTLDESGKLNDVVNANTDENTLTDEDLMNLRGEFSSFGHSFTNKDFHSTYDFKFDMEGTVLKLANYQVLSNLNILEQNNITELVDFCYAPKSGILVYNTDGYENLTVDLITPEIFNKENYEKKMTHSYDLIGQGDPVYKLITDENWSIILQIEEERALELEEKSYVQVRFLKTDTISWAAVNIIRTGENTYCKLDLNNSMINFATDRFIEIELLTSGEEGLKIPNSSIVERDFFLIPTEYGMQNGDGEDIGFIKETYLEDGTLSQEFIQAAIYHVNNDEYYVDVSAFQIGEYIIKPDSLEKYPISKKGTLIGVYNVNLGYADFRQISILYQNDEYAIVKSDTAYGLNVYDHIAQDGTSVEENDFIFE